MYTNAKPGRARGSSPTTINHIMKPIILIFLLFLPMTHKAYAQTTETTDQVIEGSKIIVELVKALSQKKSNAKASGCKNNHADLCIENKSLNSMTVILKHRASGENREVVILPEGKECSLQISVGVWNYDLRYTSTAQTMRKGDMLIKGCQNIDMHINDN